ncbi:uncharacterized protein FMAN_13028 [Fusarium mangiferae]|uniref:Alpha/beta hydrolase fold-3 domain-containing protein n=1 Tax=Fusarium mangiferae TaxID=192010 RepID=A0A1L7U2U8_FUSMA|nr:uncharacterized protein FMAN_13028 [Fusarium mangiferae]CVL05058.1 uncharacterized protein FMAN_13028 [Fusarium mangiferae]
MSKPLRVPYKIAGKTSIPTDIHIPSSRAAQKYDLLPVLIMFHGGGFMLGHSGMNNADQIEDCLERGWIVLSVEYRLCPGVNVLEGPIRDARDALLWVQEGGLEAALKESSETVCPDTKRIMAMGASAGGTLALSLAWNVPAPPIAILDFYGPKDFSNESWLQPIDGMLPRPIVSLQSSDIARLYEAKDIFAGGLSLEGQTASPLPDATLDIELDSKRKLFALQAIAQGRILSVIWPPFPSDLHLIDPLLNVDRDWPPVAIVHGNIDALVPISLSQRFADKLKQHGVETEFIEVANEPHTFLGTLIKGSKTWYTQQKGFDFLERVLMQSFKKKPHSNM